MNILLKSSDYISEDIYTYTLYMYIYMIYAIHLYMAMLTHINIRQKYQTLNFLSFLNISNFLELKL